MKTIHQDMNIYEMAKIIFKEFELNQSCVIYGFIGEGRDLKRKGEAVLEEVDRLDTAHNKADMGQGRMRRKRVVPQNTIGGYVAHKIWRFKHEIIDSNPKTSIWRIQ